MVSFCWYKYHIFPHFLFKVRFILDYLRSFSAFIFYFTANISIADKILFPTFQSLHFILSFWFYKTSALFFQLPHTDFIRQNIQVVTKLTKKERLWLKKAHHQYWVLLFLLYIFIFVCFIYSDEWDSFFQRDFMYGWK